MKKSKAQGKLSLKLRTVFLRKTKGQRNQKAKKRINSKKTNQRSKAKLKKRKWTKFCLMLKYLCLGRLTSIIEWLWE